jgi:AraC-like DNA-binding protein
MCLSTTENLLHTAFLSDAAVPQFSTRSINPTLMRSFMDAIQCCTKGSDHTKICAFLELICCDFYPDHSLLPKISQDFDFIIQEFISLHYRENAKLSDLAKMLHFSEKHTSRLVLNCTGCTFRQAITNQRMSVARHLANTTDMSLQEISQYLGYQTYSGFWKAYQKNKDI